MSECVVRMEMPKSCYECRRRYLFNKCSAYNGSVIRRSENCPILCQLPEGHGRLVDISPLDVIAFRDKDCSFYAGVLSVCERIDKLPTIVPAERSET